MTAYHGSLSSGSVVLLLVTQPMMQRQPNCTELRSMDSYIQILCRFQKCIQKVPPPSLPCTKKSTFNPPLPQDEKNLPWVILHAKTVFQS